MFVKGFSRWMYCAQTSMGVFDASFFWLPDSGADDQGNHMHSISSMRFHVVGSSNNTKLTIY
jgi:hypothetical protein